VPGHLQQAEDRARKLLQPAIRQRPADWDRREHRGFHRLVDGKIGSCHAWDYQEQHRYGRPRQSANGVKPQDAKDFPKNAKGLEKTINDLIKALKDCEATKCKAAADQPQTQPPPEGPKKEEPKKEEPKKEQGKKEEPKKEEKNEENTGEYAEPPKEIPTSSAGLHYLIKEAKEEIRAGSPYKAQWEELKKQAEAALQKLGESSAPQIPSASFENAGFFEMAARRKQNP
jgi:hypothetical protein